jgi:ABC-type nitrate/sulfonate/bicarbonate transport system permease component
MSNIVGASVRVWRERHEKSAPQSVSSMTDSGSSSNYRRLVSTVAVLVLLAAWEVAPRAGLIDSAYTSQPSRVVAAGLQIVRNSAFLHDASVSLSEFAVGFAIAIAIGVPLGLLLGTSSVLRYLLDPPIMAIYATPHLALLPILVVWLGIGMQSKIAVVFVGGVIPILVNSMAGVREVERSWIAAARSFGASRWDLLAKVRLPASLPAVIMGIRLGLSRAVLGVVVAEMFQSQAGIGNEIMRYGSEFRTDYLLFYVLLVSLFGFAATWGVRVLEERLWTSGK